MFMEGALDKLRDKALTLEMHLSIHDLGTGFE
jgi:hypothetical protein